MSNHNVNVDIQEIANSIQMIRKELDLIEHIVQQALLEGGDSGDNMD